MVAVMLGFFAVAFIAVLYMVIRIVKSLEGAVSNLGSVAKGVLNFEMKPEIVKRSDEVGDMARAIQSLIQSLHGILTNITDSSKALEDFSGQFSDSFQSISDSISNINTAVEEIAGGGVGSSE